MILMLVASLGDASLGANAPMSNADRMVLVTMLERYTAIKDTTLTIDSTQLASGAMRYDTTVDVSSNSRNTSQGSLSYHFAENNLTGFDGVAEQTLFSSGRPIDAYLDGRKVSFDLNRTDAEYWQVFDFDFVAGENYRAEDVATGQRVAVLTEKAARDYFGESGPAILGQEMVLERERYTVRGIVRQPLRADDLVGADVFVPYTAVDNRLLGKPEDLQGSFTVVLLATSPAARAQIREQLDYLADNFVMPPGESFESLGLLHGTALEAFAMETVGSQNADEAVWYLFVPVGILIIFFIVLPLLNLINLNLSRINERTSEIAVRKAFGADSSNILYQFLLENLLITTIGGVVGLVLAYLVVQYVNSAQLLGGTQLSLSSSVFFYTLLITLAFGLLSGVWPAYRMSRLAIADSLR